MPRVFIAGCGFVGLATARLFHACGWEVIGGTHSEESAARLAGEAFTSVAVDIADAAALAARSELQGLDAIIHCASSGRGGADAYRRVYLEGARQLASILAPARLVFTSSTSVYAQTDGSWVAEESAAEPDRETGRILREAEDAVLAAGGVVARLAGVYGPGRSVLLKKFLSGEAVIEGDGRRWINQGHRDDIATALFALVEHGVRGIFNVSDDTPMMQRDVYAWLAEHFQRPLPPSGPIPTDRKRGWTSKRVSNAKLRALGWAPGYPSFREAVTAEGVGLAAT
jgi:nucleoside-diphosphate-sugar epimerase